MARQRGSLIKLQGTIAGLTFVDSKAYGAHTRAARGTHKEAKVNCVLRGWRAIFLQGAKRPVTCQ